MYYLNSRYYNPEIGRFINADGLIGQTGDILGHNLYAYTQNNPVMYYDPNGESAILAILGTLAVKAIIGATIGAAVGGTAAYVVGSIQGKEGSELWNSVKAGATYGAILGFGTGIASGLGVVSASLGWGGTAKVAAWAGGTAISSISGGVAITAQNAILGKETSTTDILFHSFLGGFTGGLSFGVNNKLVYDGARRMYKYAPYYDDVPFSQKVVENMIIGGIEFVGYKGIVAAGRGAYNYLDNKWGY